MSTPRKYHLITFGCQMNQHDTDRIGDVLSGAGHEAADLADADLVVLNTCSVREKAEQKLRSEVGRLGLLKRDKPGLVIAVAGCLAQQEGDKLRRHLPQIDLVFGPDNAPELPGLLDALEQTGQAQVLTEFDLVAPRFLSAGTGPTGACAYVTTMKGCDERCTFCIVPATRGPERYRPSSQIIAEVRARVAAGAREITLLGQTVDSYLDPEGRLPSIRGSALPPQGEGAEPAAGSEGLGEAALEAPPAAGRGVRRRRDESQFPELLKAIAAEVPGLARLRYTSPHPRHLTQALVEAHRTLGVLCEHVHMPVQSGSDAVLRRMLRRYTVEEYRQRIGALRAAVPALTVSTDIIVGFPGETESDFAQTLTLVEEIGFVGVFGFKYSPRPLTPALRLGDDVPEEVKSDRLTRLFELSERLRYEHLLRQEGATVEVLIEGRDRHGNWSGRTRRGEIVHVQSSAELTGQLVQVRIEQALKHSLRASLVEERPRLPSVAAARRSLPLAH